MFLANLLKFNMSTLVRGATTAATREPAPTKLPTLTPAQVKADPSLWHHPDTVTKEFLAAWYSDTRDTHCANAGVSRDARRLVMDQGPNGSGPLLELAPIVYGEIGETVAKKHGAKSGAELAAKELTVADVGFGLAACTFFLASLGIKVISFDKDRFPHEFVRSKLLPAFHTTFKSIADGGRCSAPGQG